MRRHLVSRLVWLATLACADAPTRPTALPFDPALRVVPADAAPPGDAAGLLARRATLQATQQASGAGAARVEVVSTAVIGTFREYGLFENARPIAINAAGQVAGTNYARAGDDWSVAPGAYVWSDATGRVGLGEGTVATDLNDAGQVVGVSARLGAFLWERGAGMRGIGAPPDYENFVPFGVNNSGQVVGMASRPWVCWEGEERPEDADCAGVSDYAPAVWQAGRWLVLDYCAVPGQCGYWAGWEATLRINAAGRVAGALRTREEQYARALLWAPGDGLIDLHRLLGFPESHYGDGSVAADINDRGEVVGHTSTGYPTYTQRAFLWQAGAGVTDLGTLRGASANARAINNAGQVLGVSSVADDYLAPAFLWQRGVGMLPLPLVRGKPFNPSDINDAGQVVGSVDAGGGRRTYLRVTVRVATPGAPAVDRLQAAPLAPGVYPQYAPNGGVWLRVRLTDADTPTPGPWAWRIDWGDGVVHTPTVAIKGEFAFVRATPYASAGPHTVTVSATDPGGLASAAATTNAP